MLEYLETIAENRSKKKRSYPCNKPQRLTGLWDVQAPTFSRQPAHRWRWGRQTYAPAALYAQEDSWYSFLLEAESTRGLSAAGSIRPIEKSNDIEPATFRLVAQGLLQAKWDKTNGRKIRAYLKWLVLIHWIFRTGSVDEMDNVDAALIIHDEISTAA
jgi:hypothetical protein